MASFINKDSGKYCRPQNYVNLNSPSVRLSSSLIETSTRYPLMYGRHVKVAFPLQRENNLPKDPTPEEWEILSSLFPDFVGASVLEHFLIIYVVKLPAKLWPVSVAGLPLFLTTDERVPWTFGKVGNVKYAVLDISMPDTASKELCIKPW
ncbi:hypothetical protein EYZ11_011490 [Aspergillus tanneri]|uniref:Uncharacterized protein n=1 Tax=Aspergillus tanneri TaxID=1220188 RepID=A0A4S3J2M9_9EURO|nr:hypothetical protein EYZ11_011490 [Aspergillus tanneri]